MNSHTSWVEGKGTGKVARARVWGIKGIRGRVYGDEGIGHIGKRVYG